MLLEIKCCTPDLAQGMNAIATSPDDRIPIPGTHLSEIPEKNVVERTDSHKSPSDLHSHTMNRSFQHTYIDIHTHKNVSPNES